MNKENFIKELRLLLKSIPEEDLEDILSDYREHFRIGVERGRMEGELIESLGDPRVIAKQIKASYMVKMAESKVSVSNIVRAVIASAGLGFFNLVFVIGPFLGLVALLIGLFVAAIGTIVAGVVAFAVCLAEALGLLNSQYVYIGVNPLAGMFVFIGVTSFGLLFLICDYYLAKLFYNLTIAYLKMNIEIIMGPGRGE
jgi:uncharacterized membrane protein